MQYSLNDGPWTDYDNACGGISLEKAGDKISFRGDNAYYGQYQSGYVYSYFYSDYQDCYIYGNVMSLELHGLCDGRQNIGKLCALSPVCRG